MRRRATGALALAALAGAVVIALLAFRGAGVEAAYPVANAKTQFVRRVLSRLGGAWRGAAAGAENVRLRREVASLVLMRGDIERLEAENARLRKALGYAEGRRMDWLAASVMSRGGGAAGARQTIRVDRGTLAGVERGAVVVVPDGLVGRVVSVSPHTAEVLLVTDSGLRVSCAAEIPGGNGPRGILCGGDETHLSLRHIRPEGVAIPPRARIVTTGAAGVFPAGLEVGFSVGEGLVEPSVDFATLEDVFIRRGQ